MSSLPWFKFYPRGWTGNQQLRMVSLAARGLWLEMLSLMHEAEPYGYLVVGDKPITLQQLARAAATTEVEVERLLEELRLAGILKVDRKHRVHSPRMITQRKMSEQGRAAVNKRYSHPIDSESENQHPSRVPSTKNRERRGQETDHREEPVGSSEPRRIPDGWSPGQTTLEKTRADRPDLVGTALTAELEKFRNFWLSNGTPQAFKRDWDAAWLYWIAKWPRDAQLTVTPKETKPTVRLHRSLQPKLFEACEQLRGKKAPSDEWFFDRDLVEKANAQLTQGALKGSGWGLVNRSHTGPKD